MTTVITTRNSIEFVMKFDETETIRNAKPHILPAIKASCLDFTEGLEEKEFSLIAMTESDEINIQYFLDNLAEVGYKIEKGEENAS